MLRVTISQQILAQLKEDETMRRVSACSLAEQWHEVLPTNSVRNVAERMLRVHPLRARCSHSLG